MPEFELIVASDHVERLTKSTPSKALSELVWNSLDAEATSVSVRITKSVLAGPEGIQELEVSDNGHGISAEDLEDTFGKLGGSWKARSDRSRNKKVPLHGRNGQGRFKAISLGGLVTWSSVAKDHGVKKQTTIRLNSSAPKRCIVEHPELTSGRVGTSVKIMNPTDSAQSLANLERTRSKLTGTFALRLMADPTLNIEVNEVRLEASSIQTNSAVLQVEIPDTDGEVVDLHVIEWSVEVDRSLHLCDETGISLHNIKPGIKAPTFNFTAYLKWNGFREKEGLLALEELSPELAPAIRAAQVALRDYFKTRADQRDAEVINTWKKQKVYPYGDSDDGSVKKAEREIFDLVALTVNASNPEFSKSDPRNTKVTLRLLREAVERSPDSIHKILNEVASLNADRLNELSEILESTSLSKIVSSTRRVSNRLIFLDALETIVFEHTKSISETKHLHRILERELWLFGDHFTDALSERGLTKVLETHLRILGREKLVEPVKLVDGKTARMDLMFSAMVAGRGSRQAEHLVVELKAPKIKLGMKQLSQIEEYATAVLENPRFDTDKTQWEFWLIGNQLDATLRRKAAQPDRAPGILSQGDNYQVRVFEWSQILDEQRRRLHFMRDALEYQTNDDVTRKYLDDVHQKYLPDEVTREANVSSPTTTVS